MILNGKQLLRKQTQSFQLIKCLTNFENKNKVLKMNEAYFKHVANEGKLAISFRFVQDVDAKKIDRVFNFVRDLSEDLEVTLHRIRANLEKEFTKKHRKKSKKSQEQAEEAVESALQIKVELRDSDGLVEKKCFNDLLQRFETDTFFLNLHESQFTVKFNWPWINNVSLPTSILAGFYVYPSKLEIDFADRQSTEFIWFRGKLSGNKREEMEWEEIGKGFSLLARQEDIGYKYKVKAIPRSKDGLKEGPAVEAIAKNDVEAGPGVCPFESRNLFTMDRLSGRALRVASYNLLADYYADSEDSRTRLFNYCAPYALHIDYRKQLMLKEILGYNADIFCMQEVDFKVFDGDMVPFLGVQDMAGVHNKKGTTPEGVATFFRTDRFDLVEHHGMNIGDTIKLHPACAELWGKLQYNEKLVERISDLGTTLQVIILQSNEFPDKFIAVANTHLYFHPDADHIRLLQIGFSLILVHDVISQFKEKSSNQDISLIFCGDFNSVPECGIFKLMTEQFVPENFVDWNSNLEQAVKNVSLSQPVKMISACGTPPFTNYTVGFQACLDYIFIQNDKFKVTKVIETPDEDELKAHQAIPSVVFPSDHVAIVAELDILN